MRPTYLACLGFSLAVLLLGACSSPRRSTGREVKSETRDKRKAPVIFAAKQDDYYFNLRQNSFFDYFGQNQASGKTELYAGTYTRKGDSLFLGFHNNYQPDDLTGKGFIDRRSNTLLLISKDTSRHRRMPIILNELQ